MNQGKNLFFLYTDDFVITKFHLLLGRKTKNFDLIFVIYI